MSEVIDVVGIGNAIVDVLAHCDEAFIERMTLTKGAMTLIDTARAEELYAAMGPAIEISGGSAANTTAAVNFRPTVKLRNDFRVSIAAFTACWRHKNYLRPFARYAKQDFEQPPLQNLPTASRKSAKLPNCRPLSIGLRFHVTWQTLFPG